MKAAFSERQQHKSPHGAQILALAADSGQAGADGAGGAGEEVGYRLMHSGGVDNLKAEGERRTAFKI